MVDRTNQPDEFHFNDHEVSEVKWVPYADTEAFLKQYAKPPLQRDAITFSNLADWLRMHGLIDGNLQAK